MKYTNYSVKLADTPIRIHGMFSYSKEFCREYFTEQVPEYEIYITNRDIGQERNRLSQSSMLKEGQAAMLSADYLETMAIYRKVAANLMWKNVLPVNGILIQMDDKAVLLVGPRGVGKHTHATLWSRVFGDRVKFINDRKPLLSVGDDGVMGYGSPWGRKEEFTDNCSAPLQAICFVRRGSENSINKLPGRVGYS